MYPSMPIRHQANKVLSIPLAIAIVILVYLHRRHVKKLRSEDANDPHKSLDFGMDPSADSFHGTKKGKKGRKDGPEMTINDLGTEKTSRRPRGLSMDMDIGSPYVLPAGLSGSRESLHSMSRTIQSRDDRYRPATTFIPNDTSSVHSYPSRRAADDSSSYAGSGSSGRGRNDSMNQNLLSNAQRMSRSMPPISRNPSPQVGSNEPHFQKSGGALQVPPKALSPGPQDARLAAPSSVETRDSYMSSNGVDLRKSNNYLGPLIHSRNTSADLLSNSPSEGQKSQPSSGHLPALQQSGTRKSPPPTIGTSADAVRPPRKASLKGASHPSQELNFFDDASDYGDSFKVTPPSPKHTRSRQPSLTTRQSEQTLPPVAESYVEGLAEPDLGFDPRRLSMGFRPLPPDDPTDNPEQRANRIRSFYKEYFDESKQGPVPAAGQYYEDYDSSYLGDGAIYDPASGQFVICQPQNSEPYGRRAMTPPPRAPPRFRGAPHHYASMSGNRITPPGPRAFSSASGRFGPPARGAPRKQAPPPQPLRVLPSPHLLKEDSFALPIDFAPPSGYKDRAAGRPESPRGGMRAFSPMVPAHLPLASSFDDLSVMPSP